MRQKYNVETQKSRQEFAKEFLHSYKEALDIGTGKKRGKGNIHEKIAEWKRMAKEIETDEH